MAAGTFTALALIPALRHSANPPGVGDPDTIAGRTSGHLLAIALEVLVLALLYATLGATFGALTLRAQSAGGPRRPAELLV